MWKKISVIGGAFLLVISLVTSGFVIEDRYNNQNDHEKDLATERKVTELELQNLETELVMNLKQFQIEQKVSIEQQRRENDYRYYSGVLEDLDRKLYEVGERLRQNPNDQNALEAKVYLKKKREQVQQKLNSLMGN